MFYSCVLKSHCVLVCNWGKVESDNICSAISTVLNWKQGFDLLLLNIACYKCCTVVPHYKGSLSTETTFWWEATYTVTDSKYNAPKTMTTSTKTIFVIAWRKWHCTCILVCVPLIQLCLKYYTQKLPLYRDHLCKDLFLAVTMQLYL